MNFSRRFDMAAGIFVFLVFLLTVYLTKDFLNTILLSMVLVFLLRPLYSIFFRLTGRSQISSFFSIMIVFMLILGFLVGITTVLLVETANLERSGFVSGSQITTLIQEIEIWAKSSIPTWIYNSIIEIILRYVEEISDIPITIAKWLLPVLERGLGSFASNLPVLFAQLIVAVFFTYYILMDGKDFMAKALDLVPEEKKGLIRIFLHELNMIYDTLFSVYFTTSMLSGAMAAIGFSLAGHALSGFDGRHSGGLHPAAHARAALCIHPHGGLLFAARRYNPLPDTAGLRGSGAYDSAGEHNPPPPGHEDLPHTSYADIAGLYRAGIRGGSGGRDHRPHPLWLPAGGLPDGHHLPQG